MPFAEKIQPGDHIALFFETQREQFDCVSHYLRDGLEQNEFCFYIVSENSIPSMLLELQKLGVDTDSAQDEGALQFVTKEQSYLRHGLFDPDKMISDLKDLLQHALLSGFSGLRASGEMCWALDTPDALLTLRRYEAELHRNFGRQMTGLCQYDLRRFDKAIVSDMIRVHPKVIARGRLINNQFTCDLDALLAGRISPVFLEDLIGTAA